MGTALPTKIPPAIKALGSIKLLPLKAIDAKSNKPKCQSSMLIIVFLAVASIFSTGKKPDPTNQPEKRTSECDGCDGEQQPRRCREIFVEKIADKDTGYYCTRELKGHPKI